MLRLQEAAGESSPSRGSLAKIAMKQLNVWPLLMLLILVLFIIYWLGGGLAR